MSRNSSLHYMYIRERSNTIVLLLNIWNQGTWNRFFCCWNVPWMLQYSLTTNTSFFTLICVHRVQKTIYFLCLRRRIVSSNKRELNWSQVSRIVLMVPAYKNIFSWAAQNHPESPQVVPSLHLQKDFYYFLCSISNTIVLLVPLCTCKMGVHMTISQQSNTIVCSNFDTKIQQKYK